jgi:hypothetical protein
MPAQMDRSPGATLLSGVTELGPGPSGGQGRIGIAQGAPEGHRDLGPAGEGHDSGRPPFSSIRQADRHVDPDDHRVRELGDRLLDGVSDEGPMELPAVEHHDDPAALPDIGAGHSHPATPPADSSGLNSLNSHPICLAASAGGLAGACTNRPLSSASRSAIAGGGSSQVSAR